MKQPTAPPSGIPLYPELPITDDGTAGVSTSATSGGNVNVASQQQDQYFRLQEISRLRKHLEDEKDKRSQLYKKYRRGINAVDAVDTALISASMGMGIGGVGLLTTVIAAPVVLGLEIAALGCGLLGVAGKFIGRRLSVKAKKHDEVRVLAESKLNTIADHVSRALTDGQISDEEFRLIIDEAQKYTQMKAEIRAGAQKAHAAVTLDEETKNSLIQRGRDEARASFIKKLAAPWVVVYPASAWPVASIRLRQWRAGGGMTRLRGAPRPASRRGGGPSCDWRHWDYVSSVSLGLLMFIAELSLVWGRPRYRFRRSAANDNTKVSMDSVTKYSVTTYTCLAAAAAAASVAACTDLEARRKNYLYNRGKCYTAKTQAYQAFEKALTDWAEDKQKNPDFDSPRPKIVDFYFGGYVSEEIMPKKITLRPVTAGFGVAAVALLTAACVANEFDRRDFAELADSFEQHWLRTGFVDGFGIRLSWGWDDPPAHNRGIRCRSRGPAYCCMCGGGVRSPGFPRIIGAPRPERGWAVLSGAPGCFSGIYFWGYFGYIHGYHWSGGPPGGGAGPSWLICTSTYWS